VLAHAVEELDDGARRCGGRMPVEHDLDAVGVRDRSLFTGIGHSAQSRRDGGHAFEIARRRFR
jgi:hypothetical protein